MTLWRRTDIPVRGTKVVNNTSRTAPELVRSLALCFSLLSWYLTSTEAIRRIRDGDGFLFSLTVAVYTFLALLLVG